MPRVCTGAPDDHRGGRAAVWEDRELAERLRELPHGGRAPERHDSQELPLPMSGPPRAGG